MSNYNITTFATKLYIRVRKNLKQYFTYKDKLLLQLNFNRESRVEL
jgi:hypothetical protein